MEKTDFESRIPGLESADHVCLLRYVVTKKSYDSDM